MRISGAIQSQDLLYRGLTEAMQNVIDWAYPKEDTRENLKRWWMSAAYNASTKRAAVMINTIKSCSKAEDK